MRRRSLTNRGLVFLTMAAFAAGLAAPPRAARAQSAYALPVLPGALLALSAAHDPAMMLGVTVNLSNPFEFDFIISRGDRRLQGDDFEEESEKLIKYFLASLTTPEPEMWVNLSPYEPDRIIPERFGYTEMGRDMLAQDYILKQLTASLMFPEKEPGATFWERVYSSAQWPAAGGAAPPIADLLSRIWIVPKEAVVYEHENSAFVVSKHLKVMLEEDYLSARQPMAGNRESRGQSADPRPDRQAGRDLSTRIIREVLIPEIEREVNEGAHFANLRQIFNSMILAAWYKQALKETLLSKIYIDRHKTLGVDAGDKGAGKKIYQQYLEAFRKGVFNYIREDYDPVSQQIIPRQYFSGGVTAAEFSDQAMVVVDNAMLVTDPALKDKMDKLTHYLEKETTKGMLVSVKTALNKSSSRDKFWEVMRRITLAGFIGFAACTGGCAFNKNYVKFDNPQSFVEAGLVDRRAEPSAPAIEVRSLDDLVKYDAGYPPGLYRVGGYDPAKPVMVVIHGATDSPSRHKEYLGAFAPKANIFVFKYETMVDPGKNADLLRKEIEKSITPLGNPDVFILTFCFGGNIFVEAVRQEIQDDKTVNAFSGHNWIAVGNLLPGSQKGDLLVLPGAGGFKLIGKFFWPNAAKFFESVKPGGEEAGKRLESLPGILEVLGGVISIGGGEKDDQNPSGKSNSKFKRIFEIINNELKTVVMLETTHPDLMTGNEKIRDLIEKFMKEREVSGGLSDGAMLGGGNVKFEEPISDLNLEAIDIDPKVFDFRIDPSRSFYAMVDALKLEIPKLAERLKQQGRRQVEVLDVGTGSGVLGLFIFHEFRKYGIKVGLVAVDIDRRAVWNARDNFLKYGVPADVYPVAPDQDLSDVTGGRRFDLIVFNAPDPVEGSVAPSRLQVRMPLEQLLARVREFRAYLLAPDGVALVGGHKSITDLLTEIDIKEQYLYGKEIDTGRRTFRFTRYETGSGGEWHQALTDMEKEESKGSKEEVGGIDFNPSRMDLRIRRDALGVPLPVELQDLPNIHINGLYPVIINITPVVNPLPLLGLSSSGVPAREYQRI